MSMNPAGNHLAVSTGGYQQVDENKLQLHQQTFYYHMVEDIWTIGPELILPRAKHGCGVLKLHNDAVAVVVAGGDTPADDVSVEYLLLADSSGTATATGVTWQNGPQLPRKLEAASMAPSTDGLSLILIGGTLMTGKKSGMLLRLGCINAIIEDCSWEDMQQHLRNPRQDRDRHITTFLYLDFACYRSGFLAIKVPHHLTYCQMKDIDFGQASQPGTFLDNSGNRCIGGDDCCSFHEHGTVCDLGEGSCTVSEDCKGNPMC